MNEELGRCRSDSTERKSVANASERSHQLSKDNRFNDQTNKRSRTFKPELAYAEGILWIKGIYSFLSNSCSMAFVLSELRLNCVQSL